MAKKEFYLQKPEKNPESREVCCRSRQVDRRDQRQKHFSGRKIQESVEISRTAPQFVEGSH